MAKLKLDLGSVPDVIVIGISSHVKDYRLCWALNRSIGLSLTRRKEDIADPNSTGTAYFATFDHMDEETNARLTLIHNHSGNGILLKDQRQADYFLVVDNELVEAIPDLLERVRGTEFVLAAFTLQLDRLQSGHKLLQEST